MGVINKVTTIFNPWFKDKLVIFLIKMVNNLLFIFYYWKINEFITTNYKEFKTLLIDRNSIDKNNPEIKP